ncbi:MAG: DUF4340 domain-containing protein [Desulfobacterales bacterium]|nr:DUF4340 domain-containing protein [Desulfobacterales bacterium]
MKIKEYIILAVVIIALGLYITFRKTDKTYYDLPQVPEVNEAEITKIEICKKNSCIEFTAKDNSWYIGPKKYLADAAAVKNILGILGNVVLTDLVSESKSYERYDLTEDNRIQIKAWKGTTLVRNFTVGKAASTFRHTYIMLENNHRVYHARENFRNKVDKTLDDFRDKKVLSFEKNDIKEIHASIKESKISIIKKEIIPESDNKDDLNKDASKTEIQWEDTDGNKIDESKINSIISNISNLNCSKYLDEAEKDNLKDPIYVITAKGSKDYTLSIFDKKEGSDDYPCLSSENAYPFMLNNSTVDGIKGAIEEIIKKEEKKESVEQGTETVEEEFEVDN